MEISELNGVFIIDKPPDMTSAKVVAHVKKLHHARKVGHSGTLDPFATGVLVCCVNQATKLARFFLHGDKTYEAVLELGITTDTQDATGEIVSVVAGQWSLLTDEMIRSAFQRFEGAIEQQPPIYSALKHEGVPLYKLARRGKPVQKPPRPVFISSIQIHEINLPEIRFTVSCSSGTYIRTLAADIGEALGYGAHLKSLRRTQSSGFAIEEAIPLAELERLASSGNLSNRMIPMADALRGMPAHVADDALAKKIAHGKLITRNDMVPAETVGSGEFFKVVDAEDTLLAVLRDGEGAHKYCGVFNQV